MGNVSSGSIIAKCTDFYRSYELSWKIQSQSVDNNTSTISYTLKQVEDSSRWYECNGMTVTLAGKTIYTIPHAPKDSSMINSNRIVKEGTVTVKHNNDGTKAISASIKSKVYYHVVNCSASGSWNLKPVVRMATITSATNFSEVVNPTVTYSNPRKDDVKLEACIALVNMSDIHYRDITETNGEYTFPLTEDEKNTLLKNTNEKTPAAQKISNNSRTVQIYIKTIDGQEKYLNHKQVIFTIENPLGTFSETETTGKDINENTKQYTGNENIIILGQSKVRISYNFTAVTGAKVTALKIINGDKTDTPDIDKNNEGTVSGTYDIDKPTNNIFTIIATDSRGNNTKKTITMKSIDYFKPSCNLSAGVFSADDGKIDLTISGKVFIGSLGSSQNDIQNKIEPSYRYKEEDGTYTEWKPIVEEVTAKDNEYKTTVQLTGLNYQKEYIFQARIEDTFNTVNSNEVRKQSKPIFDWGANDFNFNVPVTMQGIPIFSPHKVLWEGEEPSLLNNDKDSLINFNEPVSSCVHGIVLFFSKIEDGNKFSQGGTMFIPKDLISDTVTSFCFNQFNYWNAIIKYFYINNNSIYGRAENATKGEYNGVAVNNALMHLVKIIGI